MGGKILDKRIYNGWALKENGFEMSKINREIYEEIKPKFKMCYVDHKTKLLDCTQDDMDKYCCIVPDGSGYGNQRYVVLSNPYNFSNDEIALACDGGNLCFGYRCDNNIFIIYID